MHFITSVAVLIATQLQSDLDAGDAPPSYTLAVAILYAAGSLAIGISIYWQAREERKREEIQRGRIDYLEKKTDEEPGKVRFAWDLARVKLEAYFDRNLYQVRMIFYVALGVMVAGFGFILWGLRIAIADPEHVKVALIASASGVITQFVGLTFMVLYKSTMLQANQFMSILERINTVGMAVGILDAIKDDAGELKDNTRVDIIRLLLATPSAQMSFKPPRTRKAATKLAEDIRV
jgi:putative ubiquitin-RnfH superfamily antitoxin RatB of RatAB toxin-antitoxin module